MKLLILLLSFSPLFGPDPSRARLHDTLIPIGLDVGWASYALKKSNVKWWCALMVTWSGTQGLAAAWNWG